MLDGLDVSMEETSVCVLDGGGNIVFEGKTSSQPDALSKFLRAAVLPSAEASCAAIPTECVPFLGGYRGVVDYQHGIAATNELIRLKPAVLSPQVWRPRSRPR